MDNREWGVRSGWGQEGGAWPRPEERFPDTEAGHTRWPAGEIGQGITQYIDVHIGVLGISVASRDIITLSAVMVRIEMPNT